MRVEHEEWLAERRLNGLVLPRMYENLYSGFIAAALLGGAAPRAATLAALIPGRPELHNADLEYLSAPKNGIDLILCFREVRGDHGPRAVALVEHKRLGPSNFPKIHTYTRRALGHEHCTHSAQAQKRRKGDPAAPAIAQLDAVVCFDDWRDSVTHGVPVAARILLDAEGRSPDAAFGGALTHPAEWSTVDYGSFGAALRTAYDRGAQNHPLRQGIEPLLRALYA